MVNRLVFGIRDLNLLLVYSLVSVIWTPDALFVGICDLNTRRLLLFVSAPPDGWYVICTTWRLIFVKSVCTNWWLIYVICTNWRLIYAICTNWRLLSVILSEPSDIWYLNHLTVDICTTWRLLFFICTNWRLIYVICTTWRLISDIYTTWMMLLLSKPSGSWYLLFYLNHPTDDIMLSAPPED